MDKGTKVGIVIPTIREESILLFLSEWNFPEYCNVYIIEDNDSTIFELPENVHFHGSWKDFNSMKNSWIFSKKCGGGIRSFGFYKAWKDGCKYIITLDDDCLPSFEYSCDEFVAKHIEKLNKRNDKWLWTTKEIRPRGVPYKNMGEEKETLINMGFWEKNADFDAVTQLSYGAIGVRPNILDPIPYGYYAPICGMNLSFKAEAVPIMFQPLMGAEYEVWRFDDIWFGIIAKKICDHLGYLIKTGEPVVIHDRASNVWSNLRKETVGMEMNENFWGIIDNVTLHGKDLQFCYLEIASELKKQKDPYYKKLGTAMEAWISLFNK